MIQPLLVYSDWGILALRIILGAVLIAHGFSKIKNIRGTAAWMGPMGFKPAIFWATAVSVLEFVGGIFITVGFLTQLVCIFLVIEFLVIIFKVQKGKPLVGGFELDLLVLGAALIILTLGGGAMSLDRTIGLILY